MEQVRRILESESNSFFKKCEERVMTELDHLIYFGIS